MAAARHHHGVVLAAGLHAAVDSRIGERGDLERARRRPLRGAHHRHRHRRQPHRTGADLRALTGRPQRRRPRLPAPQRHAARLRLRGHPGPVRGPARPRGNRHPRRRPGYRRNPPDHLGGRRGGGPLPARRPVAGQALLQPPAVQPRRHPLHIPAPLADAGHTGYAHAHVHGQRRRLRPARGGRLRRHVALHLARPRDHPGVVVATLQRGRVLRLPRPHRPRSR